jgi:hypothetical protein
VGGARVCLIPTGMAATAVTLAEVLLEQELLPVRPRRRSETVTPHWQRQLKPLTT